MRILALSALALATLATPAFAQSDDTSADGDFTGVTVVAVGGYDRVDDGVTATNGALYGASVGYDIQAGHIVLGAEAEGTFATTKECIGGACVEAGRDLYAGGRIGLPVGGKTMLYVKGGYTNARLDGTTGGTTVITQELDGVRAGVGAEANVGRLVIRLEYRYSNYEQDVIRHQGVIGVGFRF
jgi:outer membrane immunogenic protein